MTEGSEPPAGLAPGDLPPGGRPPGEPHRGGWPPGGPSAAEPDRPVIGRGRTGRPALGWTELIVGAVSYVVLQVALGAVAVVLGGGVLPPAPWLIGLSAVSALGAVAVTLALRVRSPAAIGLRRVSPRLVLLGVALGLGVWVLSRILIVVYIGVTGDISDPQEDLTRFSGPVAALLVVALGGLVVPFGEELLFRGIGYGSLRRYGVVVAAVVSGLLFALAHGLNVVFAAALLLGLLNAVLYERTRSIWPSVAAHATFNLVSFALVLAFGS